MQDRTLAIFARFVDGWTYAKIASEFGISRQRVQQIVRPPKPVYDMVKQAADEKCEECGICVEDGHVHHIKSDGLSVENFNDIAKLRYLCPTCHRKQHSEPPHSGERRDVRITVIVNDEQYAAFRNACGSKPMSAWIRSIVLEKLNGKKGQK